MSHEKQILIQFMNHVLGEYKNLLSLTVNQLAIETISEDIADEIFQIGELSPLPNSQEIRQFIKEIFALYCHAQYEFVGRWLYEPKLSNRTTPDFLINDNEYVEIYTPKLYIPDKITHNFFPSDGTYITKEINEKSRKYAQYKLTIIIQVLNNGFIGIVTKQAKRVTIVNPDHKLYVYHAGNLVYGVGAKM